MAAPLRALVVDDESPARRWLAELLKAHPEIEVTAEADGVESAREQLRREVPDILFLDVQMPPGTGFDLLPSLPPHARIVFVTAYDNFAVKAFEANAIDYLLKPVHPDRLAETVSRLLAASRNQAGPVGGTAESSGYSVVNPRLGLDDLLPLRDGSMLRMMAVNQVAAIKAVGAYTQIIISGQEPMLVFQSIGEWEERLPAPPFVRLDRSRLLNLTRIKAVKTLNRDETHVSLDQVAPPFVLGRSASRRLRDLLR